jgi:hypothetical protein
MKKIEENNALGSLQVISFQNLSTRLTKRASREARLESDYKELQRALILWVVRFDFHKA